MAPARKAEARTLLSEFLQSEIAQQHQKTIIVRVNAMDTPHFTADIAAVVRTGVHIINLPKPESADQVREAAAVINAAARRNGVENVPGLLLNIETPKALRIAAELAGAHASVVGLQIGLGDLFEPYGLRRREALAIQQVMFSVRMAAAEANVFAYDGAFANISDPDGFQEEAQWAHRLGFIGKTCIHPSQVALANEVFQPTEQEIADALRIVQAAQAAEQNAVGAYVVDGKMIDRPFVLRAQALLAAARAQGRIED